MGRMINSAGHLLILVFLRFALLPYLSYRGFPPNLAYYARWQLGTLLYVNLGQTRPYKLHVLVRAEGLAGVGALGRQEVNDACLVSLMNFN